MQMNVSRAQAKSKMPSDQSRNSANSSLVTPVEKPFHYTYLKEFRTQQCQDFLQHKCPNHRPFTCFHWHFLNQRRRRPIRKRDGTFNYSPDVYCTKFDDTTGMCPDGDDCQYLHRNTGDTERRYHLRYYKTGTCVHETDARGHCVKNGPHCAFAHGPHDLRQPVYDVREISPNPKPPTPVPEPPTTNGDLAASPVPSASSVGSVGEKDKMIIVEDPQWNDTIFVLANYKTDPCKRPPRLCRQGYACPQYHNARDRRRSPMIFRYRSTPCPNVKHGDDWGEISSCEQGDMCQYCHTRTEQQFHPEIYKSTKCNDMQQTGYCPRGPFCAFAHVEQEMSSQRDFTQELGNLAISTAAKSVTMPPNSSVTTLGQHIGLLTGSDNQHFQIPPMFNPGVIGKPRSNSQSSSYSSEGSHLGTAFQKPVTTSDHKHDDNANSVFPHGSSLGHLGLSNNPGHHQSTLFGGPNSGMSASAMPFYPTHDTVESVIGNALDDLNMDDFESALDRELDDNHSVGSSGASVSQMNTGLHIPSTSAPVNIPGGGLSTVGAPGSGGMPESPVSPLSQLPPPFVPQHIQQQQQQQQQIEQAAAAFMSRPNTTPHSSLHLGSILESPRPPGSPGNPSHGRNQHMSPGRGHNPGPDGDHHRLQEEVNTLRNKLQTWEESWNQAKQACDAWKQEASEWRKKAESLSQEKQALLQSKDEALLECKALKQEVDGLVEGSNLHILGKVSDLNALPMANLRTMQSQLRTDLDKLDRVVHVREFLLCQACKNFERSVSVLPCHHVVFCPTCAQVQTECPACHQKVTSHTNAVIPL